MNGNKCFVIIILFLIFNHLSFAQKVVVSEYYNITGVPNGEWTELLVVQDNVDLVGYTLRDNAGATGVPLQWTGGVRFKNHPLWRNLRAGTIIVINHRYSVSQRVDLDKRDGYIELDAENETYFEKRCFSCTVGIDWNEKALNIAQESDILEIIDNNDNHIHSLAHMSRPSGSWLTLLDPKVSYNGKILQDGASVRVCPGRNIASYNKGFDTLNQEVEQSIEYVTKGKPNNRNGAIDLNQLFWRSIREPEWSSPKFNAFVSSDKVTLVWNPIDDPNPSDSIRGYLIIRIPTAALSQVQTPIDGRAYNVGDKLGSGTVVAVINYSQTSRIIDKFSVPCDSSYTYRIYAFSYREDDFREDTREVFARGRSYNERTFGEVTVLKQSPPTPILSIKDNKKKFCERDSTIISIANDSLFRNMKIEWYKDYNLIIGENNASLIVKVKGAYKVKITDTLECSSWSEEVNIDVLPYPPISIFVNSKIVESDTTIVACLNDVVYLSAKGWSNYRWFMNGKLVQEGSQSSFPVVEPGSYYVEANNTICTTRTPLVTVRFLDERAKFAYDTVSFYTEQGTPYIDSSITYFNLSADTLLVNSYSFLNAGFELLAPKPPFYVLPNQNVNLSIRFSPPQSGSFTSMLLLTRQCGEDTLVLNGIKKFTPLVVSSNMLNFKTVALCSELEIDSILKIYNRSSEIIELQNFTLSTPFTILKPSFPTTISPQDSMDLMIRFTANQKGDFQTYLKILYRVNNVLDTLNILIRGETDYPNYEVKRNFEEPLILGECVNSLDTSFTIVNNSTLELELNFDNFDNSIQLLSKQIIIEPKGVVNIPISLHPYRAGLASYKLYYRISPCNIKDSVEFIVKKSGIVVSFIENTIDFGSVYICNIDSFPTRSLFAHIDGDTLGVVRIHSIRVEGGFSSNTPAGTRLKDGDAIEVGFTPDSSGYYEGKITFLVEPCFNEYEVQLKGKYIRGNYILNSRTVDFNSIEVDSSATQEVMLENTGNQIIYIVQISNVSSPFELVEPRNFPLRILPNEKLNLTFKFSPPLSRNFLQKTYIHFGEPCFTIDSILLSGKGIKPQQDAIVLELPRIKSKPMRIIQIPIKLEVLDNDRLRLSRLEFDINFNFSLFDLFRIDLEGDFANADTNKALGEVTFHLEFDTNSYVKSGVLGYLVGRVMLGNEQSTPLEFSNIGISGESNIYVEQKNGEIILDSICALDLRLISTETLPKTTYQGIRNGEIAFEIYATEDWNKLVIKVMNLLGQNIYSDTKIINPGSTSYIGIPISELPDGFYTFIFEFVGEKNYYLPPIIKVIISKGSYVISL
jgi:hypothetical protein